MNEERLLVQYEYSRLVLNFTGLIASVVACIIDILIIEKEFKTVLITSKKSNFVIKAVKMEIGERSCNNLHANIFLISA
jgi:hypothetical protein